MRADLSKIREWPLTDVADLAADPIEVGHRILGNAEMTRRTAKAQIDSARYMLLSVMVLAATALLSWLWPNPLHPH